MSETTRSPMAAHCQACGLALWQGRPLMLEPYHVNGDSADDRRSNLMMLCPNCHSQTGAGERRAARRATLRLVRGGGRSAAPARSISGHAPPLALVSPPGGDDAA